MRIIEVCDEAGFRDLRESWTDLADRASASVFLRHEWFSAVWAWRRSDSALWLVCAYVGDQLVAVLPLLRPRWSPVRGRVLQFLTAPDTQLCDAIIDPLHGAAASRALVDCLEAKAAQWDVMRLERLPPQSCVETALAPSLGARHIPWTIEAVDCNLTVDLRGSWSEYYGSRSRRVKKSCNLAANRMARGGTIQLEHLAPQDGDLQRFERFLAEALNLSARSWKHGSGTSMDQPGHRIFIETLSRLAFQQGWLSIWLLKLQDVCIAMEYQLVDRGRVHALRADFDSAYKNVSPGAYLNRQLLEKMFQGESDAYCMGPGRNEYKKSWSAVGDAVYTLRAHAPTLAGRAWRACSGVKPALRVLKRRLTV